MTRLRLPIATLTFNAEFWPRLDRDDDRVAYFRELIHAGQELPPLKVQQGTSIVLGGWHTAEAYLQEGHADHFVEYVDVDPADRLLFAYREDVAAALRYTDADTRSVARRLYQQRCSNGDVPNVTTLAADLGRSQQTVARWLKDLVEAREQDVKLKRAARELAVHAFREAKVSMGNIAGLLGISRGQVFSDTHVSITEHLADSRIVTAAHGLIHLALGQGATLAEMEAARDWLYGQTNPEHLEQRERRRVCGAIAAEVTEWAERIAALPAAPDNWTDCDAQRTAIVRALETVDAYLVELHRRIA